MNLLLATDSYKLTHFKQYPPGTQYVYSYLESRGGFFNEVTFFGLQYYLKKFLAGVVFDHLDIGEAEKFAEAHFGRKGCFNAEGWSQLLKAHDGGLPVRIKAVPEGTTVGIKNVLMTLENTDPNFPWLTNYLETLLLKVWYPITVCTLSRQIKKVIHEFHIKTGCDPAGVMFKLHDFGYRGVSSEETAAIGGAAYLVNFLGSDTIAGILATQDYYHAEGMTGFSIPAAEHSTITSWGSAGEVDAFRNMLTQWDGLVAVVSDSYDLEFAVKELWGGMLREDAMRRNGTLIVRPDSGNPRDVVLQVLGWLGEKFGHTTNQKGYRVLCPKVRIIQGDGVNYYTIQDTLATMAKQGWAAENVAFGMGGALLQQLNRDTQQFAIKCSSVTVNGVERQVWKSPKGDVSKASKRGRLVLGHDGKEFHTLECGDRTVSYPDHLNTVFEDGIVYDDDNHFDEIRQRASL